MRPLWGDGEFVDRLSVDGSGRFVLALLEVGSGNAAMRLFDGATARAAGPRLPLQGVGCLAGPAVGAPGGGPAAVDVTPDRLRFWDPRTGALLRETPVRLPFTEVMAAAVDGGVLVVQGRLDHRSCGWEAREALTGEPLAGAGDAHYAYFLWEARVLLVAGLLVVTAQRTHVAKDMPEDGDVQTAEARVHRLPVTGTGSGSGDGPYGAVELTDGPDAFAAAVLGGRPVLAAGGGRVYALPTLAPGPRLAGARGQIALAELAGRPVAVAETGSPGELGLWRLDRPEAPAAVLRDGLRGEVTDLALTANGTLLVATTHGLWATRVPQRSDDSGL